MNITFLGHACFSFKIGNKNFLLDPYIRSNPLAKHIDINTIKADYILITHGHYDHVEDVEPIYNNNNASIIVANFEVSAWFKKKGCIRVHPMSCGGTFSADGVKVKMLPAVHSSSMPDGSYGGNATSLLLSAEDKNIYLAGDTGLHQDMKLAGDLYNIDIAILPIGGNFTMDIEESFSASNFLQAKKTIAMHYDTFEAIVIDKTHVKKRIEAQKQNYIFMDIGETITV